MEKSYRRAGSILRYVELVRRPGFTAFALASAGVLWSAALVAAAFLAPLYSTSAGPGDVRGTATLVEENGLSVLVPVAFPLVVSLLVWGLLRLTCSVGSPVAARTALILIALLGVFTLVAASIGLLVLPVAILLALACAATPRAQYSTRSR
jgi:hypothetical protein